ncbi:hypothetical protein JMJ35_002132 [Cladonia borealis]|uniref:Uncharacterized protein n=1 Tax=Cladonia borealis TaxID=184061 RepID=A0AA39RA26_9LECA|nr:hypothetical protein JMJ35_002132 [Cladonia borealis]
MITYTIFKDNTNSTIAHLGSATSTPMDPALTAVHGSPSAEPSYREKKSLLGSRRYLRQDLWTWPAIEQGLKDVFGPAATVRDHTQREALQLSASWTPESIIILPTGGGKGTLYLVLSRLQAAEVTIVIVPLIALRQDLIRRCREYGIPHWHYNNVDRMQERLHAVPHLVFVDVESAVTQHWYTAEDI